MEGVVTRISKSVELIKEKKIHKRKKVNIQDIIDKLVECILMNRSFGIPVTS